MATTLNLKEMLSLSDKLKIQLALLQNQVQLSDTLSLGDGFKLIEQNIQLRPLADLVSLLDKVVQHQQNLKSNSPSDSILLSDSLQLSLVPLLKLAESFALSDSLKLQIGSALSFADSLSLLDSAGLKLIENILLNLSDTLNLSDSIQDSASSDLDNYLRRYLNDVS